MATRPVLRIFISSTATDLTSYREKVRDAVAQLENLPVAMETFSASGREPADECMRQAANADAVICFVAHRYGYVPPVELGGDGERSITWLEVDAAKRAGKPVFAFLVDPKTPWTEMKEQDRLTTEPEKALEIAKAVQKLTEFRKWLGDHFTTHPFDSPETLSQAVTIALAKFQPAASVHTARVWAPLFCHALQPAQHFRGRAIKLGELKQWLESPVTPDRVVSVVAAGGTGKTALVHEALNQAALSDRSGVFVWSFYEDSHTDAFLRAAYLYFTGEKDAPAGGMLERLQMALSGDLPHILVLDGLERVQSEGGSRRRGELDDLQLKRLLRSLAGGRSNARAVVTSRFALVDLEEYTGAGHRAIALDDLEESVALEVLRAWGVERTDGELRKLIEPLNMSGLYHALSVAVFGSYIGNFHGSLPDFSLEDAQEADPKARRLHRILTQYAQVLSAPERDLLARLSLFPRGVRVELLGWIVQSGGELAGALVGMSDHTLISQLERLKRLGLVFSYATEQEIAYSAHPFLRDFFRGLLKADAASVHEAVRARLAPTLQGQPEKPSDPALLDRFELLIEQSLLAGRVEDAFQLYWNGLGNWAHLGAVLGENSRGIRILERFFVHDDRSELSRRLEGQWESTLFNDLGLFAEHLGDMTRAVSAIQRAYELSDVTNNRGAANDNLAEVAMNSGRYPESLQFSETAVSISSELYSYARRAIAHFALGNLDRAFDDFEHATRLFGGALISNIGLLEAECHARSGDAARSRGLQSVPHERATDVCGSSALFAEFFAQEEPGQSAKLLASARGFADKSGHVELQLRCFRAASSLQRELRNFPQAIAEAEAGILLADTCGFGKFSIELRISLAEAQLLAGEPQKALQAARWALDRSEQPECQYAWGKADGLHFCGLAHLQLGEHELARQRLTAALELRSKIGHGRVEETRRALERL
jgi:tetratricopeptide (TPR) repeat protein